MKKYPLDLGVVENTPDLVATVDQLREGARDALATAGRFMVVWDDGADGVTYTGYAGDAGGDALAFFGFAAARALNTFAQIMEAPPELAAKAALQIIEELE